MKALFEDTWVQMDGARRILAGELPGAETERHGSRVRVCDAGVSRFLCEPDEK